MGFARFGSQIDPRFIRTSYLFSNLRLGSKLAFPHKYPCAFTQCVENARSPTPGKFSNGGRMSLRPLALVLLLLAVLFPVTLFAQQKSILFDAAHAQTAGNADWTLDEDSCGTAQR